MNEELTRPSRTAVLSGDNEDNKNLVLRKHTNEQRGHLITAVWEQRREKKDKVSGCENVPWMELK